MTTIQCAEKRLFDLVVSCMGMIFLFIPFCIIALLVKISSRGTILFIQNRIGKNGKEFKCVKFRTMYMDSEKYGSVTTAKDNRITPVGSFLRKFKLDELPQLWNVFVGNMSFVGPRPDVAGYADKLTGKAAAILSLRPGITGSATLYFRDEEEQLAKVEDPVEYNDTVIWPKKVALNIEYVNTWSFFKDIGYILITIFPALDNFLGLVDKR